MNFAEEIFELITMSRVSHTHTRLRKVFSFSATEHTEEEKKEVKYIKALLRFLRRVKAHFVYIFPFSWCLLLVR
jgi:hypothetical protein